RNRSAWGSVVTCQPNGSSRMCATELDRADDHGTTLASTNWTSAGTSMTLHNPRIDRNGFLRRWSSFALMSLVIWCGAAFADDAVTGRTISVVVGFSTGGAY